MARNPIGTLVRAAEAASEPGRQVTWRLHVLDLSTSAVTDTWVVPAAGDGSPRVLALAAFSPAVQQG